jgi:hypothetical protein
MSGRRKIMSCLGQLINLLAKREWLISEVRREEAAWAEMQNEKSLGSSGESDF